MNQVTPENNSIQWSEVFSNCEIQVRQIAFQQIINIWERRHKEAFGYSWHHISIVTKGNDLNLVTSQLQPFLCLKGPNKEPLVNELTITIFN